MQHRLQALCDRTAPISCRFRSIPEPSRRPPVGSREMPVLALAATIAAAWLPPVPGAPTRPFDPGLHPFEGGRHRGVDLATRPGATVRAPCDGAVAFAGRVGVTGRVVTLRCGVWRVTHLPLATIAVRPGSEVDRGAVLGTVASSPDHRGLHLGVRRGGRRFGYVNPLDFLGTRATTPPPPLGRAPRPRRTTPPADPTTRSPPAPVRAPARRVAPRFDRAPARRGVPSSARRIVPGSNRGPRAPFAPWPAWLGLALVLAGAGVGVRRRRAGARGRVAAAGTLTR
jgi:peptidase M23-like protein